MNSNFRLNIFGMPMMNQEKSKVFIPKKGDCDEFVEMMKIKAAGDTAALARQAKKQNARKRLPEHIRNFMATYESGLCSRMEKYNSFGRVR